MTRREMREHAFKQLFLKEFYDSEEYKEQCQLYLEELEVELEEKDREELAEKAAAMYAKITELDEKINAAAKGWTTSRMAKVDVTILRLALYEILFEEDVPEKVAINEAVEIAKIYGGDESPAFINGILGKLVREI